MKMNNIARRPVFLIATLLLITTSSASAQKHVQLTFEVKDSTVVMKGVGGDDRTFSWIELVGALVPLAALGVAVYSISVSKKMAKIPIHAVMVERQIETATELIKNMMHIALTYGELAEQYPHINEVTENMRRSIGAKDLVTGLLPTVHLVMPSRVVDALYQAFREEEVLHSALQRPDMKRDDLLALAEKMQESVRALINTMRAELNTDALSKEQAELYGRSTS